MAMPVGANLARHAINPQKLLGWGHSNHHGIGVVEGDSGRRALEPFARVFVASKDLCEFGSNRRPTHRAVSSANFWIIGNGGLEKAVNKDLYRY